MQTDHSVPLLRRRRQLRPSTQRRAALARATPFAVAICVGFLMMFLLSGRTNDMAYAEQQRQLRLRGSIIINDALKDADADRMQRLNNHDTNEQTGLIPAVEPSPSPTPSISVSPSPTITPTPSVTPSVSISPTPSLSVSPAVGGTAKEPSNPTLEATIEASPQIEIAAEESTEPSPTVSELP